MSMTDNKTCMITYYKIKHIEDDTKDSFISSTKSKKPVFMGRPSMNLYIKKNGGRKKWVHEILETKLCETSQQRCTREYELHIQHNIKPSCMLTAACKVYNKQTMLKLI